MLLLGLTGGIAMGKSTAGGMLARHGLAVADTDVLARQVVEPGQPALEEIRRAFGAEFLDPAGRLRRAALGELVFADEAARRRLEAIVHPRIRALWVAEAAGWRARGCWAGVVIIPLLFETEAAAQFGATVCVACTAPTQQARMAERGWSPADAARRNAAQLPIADKLARADYVVWSEGSLAAHEEQWRRIIQARTGRWEA